MTCVWDAIIKKLNLKTTPEGLLQKIKNKNIKTIDILWNGQELSDQTMEENIERIKSIKKIKDGYDCSACDPLLLLIAQLYNRTIIHKYRGVTIKYTNKNNPKKILEFTSNTEHFW